MFRSWSLYVLDPTPESKVLSKATIADVAKRAGVSIATVSRFINETAPVAEKTASQVQAAIMELEYMPSAAAKSLASRKTDTLGLLLPDISSDFFPPMFRGIEAGARESGFGLLISTQGGAGPRTGLYRPLGEHNSDGLLIFTDSLNETELTRLYNLNFPMVLLYQSPPQGLNIPYVAFENKSGSYKLVEHLIKVHDCHQIAFLRGLEGHEDSYWRELGYREALAAYGLPIDPALVVEGGFSEEEGRLRLERWLNEGLGIDAIFAGDDSTASDVITILKQAGKLVPEDIAVVGFDDIPTSRYLTPSLTTVRAPIETAGYRAARHLVQLIRTRSVEPFILLPTELVVRCSCGCKCQEGV
jgi:LacI family transcriptional regulator